MLGFHAKLAKLRGAKKVIMIEINDNRLETAKQFGGVAKGALTELDTNYIHYNGLWIYGHYGSNSMQVQNLLNLQFLTNLNPRNLSLIFYHLVKLIKELPLLNLGKQ